ncbi:hypothetical protein [Terricaulis sp.]|uniref:hypothetical protein n=1 Tax=Terricaulis sp. TaxID=2768686 RepID=UPI003784CC0F
MSRSLFLAAILIASPAFADTRFFAALDDVPLAPGLSEGAGFQFEEAGGRIIGATATGRATPEAVRAFYADTLPSLGWSLSPTGADELVFLRGRERLAFSIRRDGQGAALDVRLFTRPASMNAD